jgi:hypothetical protein
MTDLFWWALSTVIVLYAAICIGMHLEGRYGDDD